MNTYVEEKISRFYNTKTVKNTDFPLYYFKIYNIVLEKYYAVSTAFTKCVTIPDCYAYCAGREPCYLL